MRRRSGFAVAFVALLTVGWSVVTTQPGDRALAADPQSELAETRARLADAQSTRSALEGTLDRQRAELSQLRTRSAELDGRLDAARAELAEVTAEFDRVTGLLAEVEAQIVEIEKRLVELQAQIEALDAELTALALEIRRRSADLAEREALLEDHLRSAYERSQTSLLEFLLSARLARRGHDPGWLPDGSLGAGRRRWPTRFAPSVRSSRLAERRCARAAARSARRARSLGTKRPPCNGTSRRARGASRRSLPDSALAAEEKRAAQEVALNAALGAQDDVEAKIAQNERAAQAAAALASQLQAQAAAQEAAIAEAKRRAAEEARRRAAAEAAAAANRQSSYGFRWPERPTEVTQEWGPTSFQLEPPYTYEGTYYPHFHAGIDFTAGCGTPIHAAGAGVVVASGQPLLPWDTGFGVVVDHGGGIQTWYWHMQPRVVVSPGADRDERIGDRLRGHHRALDRAATSTSRSTTTASGRTRAATCPEGGPHAGQRAVEAGRRFAGPVYQ